MITDQELPRLEIEESTESYARVVAEPLQLGYGTTLGNSLRRVLLSAFPGAAIVSVRVDQVQHEFSTIAHVTEDTTEFLLNVRAIRLRALSDRPAKLFLDVSGEREVKAGDLEVPGDYEIVNPELHLATMDSPQARLTATFDVEQGVGYVPAGEAAGLPIGVIPIDAVFTPVRKVNYAVQPTRIGQESDLDRLILEVWTDGTLGGEDAVRTAAESLQQELQIFVHLGSPPPAAAAQPGEALGLTPERYNTSIEDLSLSVRAYNCLKRSGLMTVGQVLEKGEEELLSLRNFGEKSYWELMDRLLEMGFITDDDQRLKRTREAEYGEGPAGRLPVEEDREYARFEEFTPEEADEEISSLGTALLEALREAGQEPDSGQ